jgi:hypothetical protein
LSTTCGSWLLARFLERPHNGKLVKITSTTADSLPLDSDRAMLWYLDKIGRQGFEFVRERRDASSS